MQAAQLAPTAVVSILQPKSKFDLSGLSQEQQTTLKLCVLEFRSTGNRIVREMFSMTTQLATMQEILGDMLYEFAEGELNISRRTVTRYLHIHKVLMAHFSKEGQISVHEASQFKQTALMLLTDNTDASIVEELKTIAGTGKVINEKIVQEVLDGHARETNADLAAAHAEVETLTKSLAKTNEKMEIERLRHQEQLRNSEEQIRRSNEIKQSLEEEIETMRKSPTNVGVQEKEVLPKEFATVAEAVDSKKQQLAELEARLGSVNEEIAKSQKAHETLTQKLDLTKKNASGFIELKEHVDALLTKFPAALIDAMSTTDPSLRTAINAIGQAMIRFGSQLTVDASAPK